jgi:hypothetical protein
MRSFAQKQNQRQKPVSSSLAAPKTSTPERHHREHCILHLQPTIGNQAAQRMLQRNAEKLAARQSGPASPKFGHDLSRIPLYPPATGAIQTKLSNQLGEGYNRDIDRISVAMTRMPEPQLQRACACGNHTMAGGECSECSKKKRLSLQTKLMVNEPGDTYEQEADQIANQVIGMPAQHALSGAAPRIQRFPAQSSRSMNAAPPSVDQALAGLGRPLEPAIRQDMEGRFGYDFSRVRVHCGRAAEQSARDVNAKAYAVGHDIVFGAGQFAPETSTGRLLLAHELAHTVQQAKPGAGPARLLQRKIGDGHDLRAPRFAGNVELEAAFDGELVISVSSNPKGTHVRLIQESLLAQGYTLPTFGANSVFGPETEAAVIRFQTDAGATKKDGVVNRQTMRLLDEHDPSLSKGAGPVAMTGPVPGPASPPAPGCDARFAGVTFTLTNQTGSGVSPAAAITIVDTGGGKMGLQMEGTKPVTYEPKVKISAPSDAIAREFEVGFISNLLSVDDHAEFLASVVWTGKRLFVLRTVVPTPIKDGAPLSSGLYDPVFARSPRPGFLEDFTGKGATAKLSFFDTPRAGVYLDPLDNSACKGPLPPAIMTSMIMHQEFRTWVGVRHKASGCVRTLHHIDWNLPWSANVTVAGGNPRAAITSNVIKVTEPNGDGRPQFIQGGQVAEDAAHKTCA